MVKINGKNVAMDTLEMDSVGFGAGPRFEEVSWEYAEFEDGTPLTEAEMDVLRNVHPVPYEDIINLYV
jgi:hypothetical protein